MTIPTTIRRSIVGLVIYFIIGGGAALLLGTLGYWDFINGSKQMGELLGVAGLSAFLGTALQGYVYTLGSITLTDTGITVDNWLSLGGHQDGQALWRNVEDVTYRQNSVLGLASIFGYGTLVVQTAGTERNLRISWVPDIAAVTNEIQQLVGGARLPVTTA